MTFKKFYLQLLLTLASFGAFAQGFDGKVTATMRAIAVPDEMKGSEAMMNQDMTIYTKKEKTRFELSSMMGTTVIISDTLKKESIVLMDMMGQKIAMKQPLDDNSSNSSFGFKVEGGKFTSTKETKMIAGYKCIKGIYTFPTENEEGTSEVTLWYTESFTNPDSASDIPGMVMEYIMTMDGMTLQFMVTAVSKENVDDSKFAIPTGYTVKTQEEFQNLIPTMGK